MTDNPPRWFVGFRMHPPRVEVFEAFSDTPIPTLPCAGWADAVFTFVGEITMMEAAPALAAGGSYLTRFGDRIERMHVPLDPGETVASVFQGRETGSSYPITGYPRPTEVPE